MAGSGEKFLFAPSVLNFETEFSDLFPGGVGTLPETSTLETVPGGDGDLSAAFGARDIGCDEQGHAVCYRVCFAIVKSRIDSLGIKDIVGRRFALCRMQLKRVGNRKNLGVMPVCKGLFLHPRHDEEQAFFFGSTGVGISVCSQSAVMLPPKKVTLPRWGLIKPDEGRGRGHLNLDVVDGLNVDGRNEDRAIFLFSSPQAVKRFVESDNGTLELHQFDPHEYGLQELFDLMEWSRLLDTPPVMYGVIDAKNIHPGQGLRAFLLSGALVEIDTALNNGTEDISVETSFVMNY